MKNLYLLPTYKASRLHNTFNVLRLERGFELSPCNLNIYITSTNEEIKEGDWFLYDNNSISKSYKLFHVKFDNPKKIILTDNKDLIKDGVQAIDDEFLEWFVKNPSCESVEIERDSREVGVHNGGVAIEYGLYEIIIPKEEAKQDLEKEMFELEQELNIPSNLRWHNSKPKQETLEEAARNYRDLKLPDDLYDAFIAGAKWQQEKMYSEEEVINISHDREQYLIESIGQYYESIGEWFEQYKKK